MKIIVGLGNPGKKYENTRHNVGFLAIDSLQKSFGGNDWQDSRFHAITSETGTVIFIKPLTFMNLSGDAVSSIVNYYKLDPKNDILIISDDLDMEFAKVRFREKGSHGGQNGLKDIITKLGTDEFSRIKIGIGRHEKYEVVDWVLSKFQKNEEKILHEEVFPKVEDLIKKWLSS
ncbi:MAG: aminoacyl-tRNA hydrolase [Candidatus Altimarinota bacterium]